MSDAWACGFACVALVLVVHYPSLFGYFQADDFVWLQHGHWRDGWQAWSGSWGLGVAYRPLTRLSYVVDARVFGDRAWGWHAVNLCLHAANAVLVGTLARRVGWGSGAAMAVACVFAAFPMDWESVDWVSGRTGLLCVLFGLLAVLAWLDWLLGDRLRGLMAMGVWQVLALLSYEPAAVLPAVVAVGGAMLVRNRRAGRAAAVLAVAAACGVDGVFWLARWALLGQAGMSTDVAAPHVAWGVARNVAAMGMHALHFLSAPVVLAVLLVLAFGLFVRRVAVAGCLLMCCVLYAPFALVDGFTERFAYAASVPLACALVVSARALPGGARWRGVMLGGLIVVFAVRSHVEALGMRRAGDTVHRMLMGIRALAGVHANLVFVGVPDNLGHFYLLRGAFEQAAGREAPQADVVARVETVCANQALRARVMTGKWSAFAYNSASGGFAPTTWEDGCLR